MRFRLNLEKILYLWILWRKRKWVVKYENFAFISNFYRFNLRNLDTVFIRRIQLILLNSLLWFCKCVFFHYSLILCLIPNSYFFYYTQSFRTIKNNDKDKSERAIMINRFLCFLLLVFLIGSNFSFKKKYSIVEDSFLCL